MTIEAKSLEEQKPFDKLQVLLIGHEKGGKSWLAATAPKPVLFIDFDQRADALSGRKGVYALTLRDPAPHMTPTAFNEFLDILTQLETSPDLSKLSYLAKFNIANGTNLATLVLDSVTTAARSAMKYALYTNGDLRRRISFSTDGGKSWSVDFVRNFDGWNAEMSTVESAIMRCLALPSHLIATVHQTEEEAADSTIDKKKFTGKIGVFPARYQLLMKSFNEIWHVEQAPNPENPSSPIYVPRVQVRADYRCPWACTNLLLEQFESPDIERMIKKHEYNSVGKLPGEAKLLSQTQQ